MSGDPFSNLRSRFYRSSHLITRMRALYIVSKGQSEKEKMLINGGQI